MNTIGPITRAEKAEAEVERLRGEMSYLAKETGWEPGQQREGGLPGEIATPVDHALEQFVVLGKQLGEQEAQLERLREGIEQRFKDEMVRCLDSEFRRQARNLPPRDDYASGFDAGIREVKKILRHPNVRLLDEQGVSE